MQKPLSLSVVLAVAITLFIAPVAADALEANDIQSSAEPIEVQAVEQTTEQEQIQSASQEVSSELPSAGSEQEGPSARQPENTTASLAEPTSAEQKSIVLAATPEKQSAQREPAVQAKDNSENPASSNVLADTSAQPQSESKEQAEGADGLEQPEQGNSEKETPSQEAAAEEDEAPEAYEAPEAHEAPNAPDAQPVIPQVLAPAKTVEPLTISDEAVQPETPEVPLKAGIYSIQSSLAGTLVLDVAGGSTKDCGNVWVYSANRTDAQRWRLDYDEEGAYTITNIKSGKALDLSGAYTRNQQNIWQYSSNGTAAQKWFIQKDGSGYSIASAKNRGFVVDVAGAQTKAGTNVWLYKGNGTPAQRWWFIPEEPEVVSEQVVENGVYAIAVASDTKYVVDVAGGSYADTGNVWVYTGNETTAQKWAITWNNAGYYTVNNIGSGKALDIAGGLSANRANIQQYSGNNTPAQRWAISKNANGSYTFTSLLSGAKLSLAASKPANGTNVYTHTASSAQAHSFALKKTSILTDGQVYTISSLSNSNQVLDVPGALLDPNVQIHTYAKNNTLAQKFAARKISDDTFAFQSVASGLFLASENGKMVQVAKSNKENWGWNVAFRGNGLVFTNNATGEVAAVSGSKASNGTKVSSASYTGRAVQKFRAKEVAAFEPGYYKFLFAPDCTKAVDIAGDARTTGANVALGASSSAATQKYLVASLGSDWYRITNVTTGRVLDVADGSTASGANVCAYARNNTNAQKWKISYNADGTFRLINALSGKVLNVASASPRVGANVDVVTNANAAGQQFRLKQLATPNDLVDLNVPCYYQNPELPTGCESVALTNMLRYYGFNLSKTAIADRYLSYSNTDFVYSYMGNPYTNSGAVVMPPGLASAGNRYLSAQGANQICFDATGSSMDTLLNYLREGMPAVVWTTMYFANLDKAIAHSGKWTMYWNTHAVTLSGYDPKTNRIRVADPLDGLVWRDASRFTSIYNQMGRLAVILK